ncbi:hypothetical protein EX30DRAFT_351523 [Ascodesmis nigricans]|uniref:A-kinase anchor protein 7-like phosphoesterase domain-containing protein n=1 Tax=Ascodesmis nigricans TaxID=341454 RepID=A0A4S2MLF9_9PEZI|nr:hypothetical protein EX30DRAFT_351523 [Ascodesmis nigricans]
MSLDIHPTTHLLNRPRRDRKLHEQQQPAIPPSRLLPSLPKRTHILCIPLHYSPHKLPTLHRHLSPLNLPRSTLLPASTLHIKICDLSLPTATLLHRAQDLLSTLDLRTLLPSGPPKLSLRGLHIPSDHDPAYARRILTTPHDPSGELQRFVERLKGIFLAAGLAQDWPSVKLAWREVDPDEEWRVEMEVRVVDMLESGVWADTRDARGVMAEEGVGEMMVAGGFEIGEVAIWERRGGREVAVRKVRERARL